MKPCPEIMQIKTDLDADVEHSGYITVYRMFCFSDLGHDHHINRVGDASFSIRDQVRGRVWNQIADPMVSIIDEIMILPILLNPPLV